MAKYLIDVVIGGATVLGKAFITAYRNVAGQSAASTAQKAANSGARNIPHAHRPAASSRAAAHQKHLLTEARQILNIDKTEVTDPVELKALINKNYEHLYLSNEVPKGGSFYIQSKLFRAKEVLEQEFVRKHRISLAPNAPNVPGQVPQKPSVLGWFSASVAPKPAAHSHKPMHHGPQLPPDQQPPSA